MRLYLEVKDGSNTVTWEVQLGSPNLQMMNGWKIDTYRPVDNEFILLKDDGVSHRVVVLT